MTKEKEIYENLKKLDMSEIGLYLTIRNCMQEHIYGISKDKILNSSNESKEKVAELLDKLVEKEYVEIVGGLVSIKDYARRITNKDVKKYTFKNSTCLMLPRSLVLNKKYQNMSNDGKITYSFCLSILDTMIKTGNINSKGEIFIKLTNNVIGIFKETLGIKDNSAMVKIIRELEDYGLVDVEINEKEKDMKIFIHFVP